MYIGGKRHFPILITFGISNEFKTTTLRQQYIDKFVNYFVCIIYFEIRKIILIYLYLKKIIDLSNITFHL
jgi:hypothetical protein